MSTDRELLELAAKAIDGEFDHGADCITMDGIEYEQWNPLTDDGDALRLAVKLRKMPALLKDGAGVMVGYEHKRNSFAPIIELFGEDDQAATRRAIVRAAAEIGKGMP